MARADTFTLLPLDSFAQVMGINPIHFSSGKVDLLFPGNLCKDRWRQYDWQDDGKVSRDGIAREIARAERDIASFLGWWPAPFWTQNEEIMWPRHYRHDRTASGGVGVAGYSKNVQTEWGHFIEGGQRAVTLLEAETAVVYSDEDDDTFEETATVTVTGLSESLAACQLKIFFAGKDGAQTWEIRPHRTRTFAAGTLTMTFWSWQLVRPELQEALIGAFRDIDVAVDTNLVEEVDLYREYTDPTNSGSFVWTSQSIDTSDITQSANLQVWNAASGMISPLAASYADGAWTEGCWSVGYEPDRVLASYKSGLQEGLCSPVPYDLAQAITYMATARLSRPLCHECQSLRDREKELKLDLAVAGPNESRYTTQQVAEAPFGTRRGEVDAWMIVKSRLISKGPRGRAALI